MGRNILSICDSCEEYIFHLRDRAGVPNLKLSKRVGKFTMDGKLIAEYRSVAYAAEQHNVRSWSIISNIQGKTKHARGHSWRYL